MSTVAIKNEKIKKHLIITFVFGLNYQYRLLEVRFKLNPTTPKDTRKPS